MESRKGKRVGREGERRQFISFACRCELGTDQKFEDAFAMCYMSFFDDCTSGFPFKSKSVEQVFLIFESVTTA